MKPSLDYFAGHPVTEIRQTGEDWQWAIVFETGAVIKNSDKRRTAAPGSIVGYVFSHIEDPGPDELNVDLIFTWRVDENTTNTTPVTMTKTQLSIADPNIKTDSEFYPYLDAAQPEPAPVDPWASS